MKLLASDDLQHARVCDADALRDGAEAHALGVGRANGSAPFLLSSGALAGETAKVGDGQLGDEQFGAEKQFLSFRHSPLILQGYGLVHKTIRDCQRVFGRKRPDVLGGACVQRSVCGAVGVHAVRIVNGARYVK